MCVRFTWLLTLLPPSPSHLLCSVISSEYGYGARGAGGVIPGGATLYFEVELVSVNGGEL